MLLKPKAAEMLIVTHCSVVDVIVGVCSGVGCGHRLRAESLACGRRCTLADVMVRSSPSEKLGRFRYGRALLPFARRTVMCDLMRCSGVHPTALPRVTVGLLSELRTGKDEIRYLRLCLPCNVVRPLVVSEGGGL